MTKIESKINYKKKLKILETAKQHVRKDGWTDNLFKKIITKDISTSDLLRFFPDGYKDLLIFSLDEINVSIENNIKKINLINFPLHKRIKKILIIRLKILDADRIFYKKTFNHLLLPKNSKIMKKNLYKSIDNIWYLAGDNSTDFSFYTKRLTLAAIYVNALFVLYNKGILEADLNLDKNLIRISKIPKLKDRFSFLKDNMPFFLKGFLN
ncbi:MAG: hypothetical protein CBD97_03875 [Pelagibacteraceae bacterium TMED237]|nr:MAG: hypothetical protein CBD97_03875 [Pelagibacteraceae bacterium TMED237]|tara:strand:+ start:2945 stop:3574 length:630 start_codon:yes stop_codon:yes gene_type:complete